MTAPWNRFVATGSGQLAWRVSIDGWPADLVTHRDMVFPIKAYARGVFSASNYYQAASASVLQGGTNMSGAVLFKYNATPGANAVLIEQLSATGGWWVYTNAAGQVVASIRNSGGTLQGAEISGLTAGVVYAVAWSWDGTNHRVALVGDDGSSTTVNETPSFTYNAPGAGPPAIGALNGGGNPATNANIIGALWADTTSKSEAELTAICEACLQAGQVVEYVGVTNMWRAPDLGTDLLGSVDFTEQGSVPRVAVEVRNTDGRERAHGLSSDGFTFGQKVDLVTSKAEGSSFRVRFANAKKGAEIFGKRPSRVTYLVPTTGSSITSTAATIPCKGAGAFPSSGRIHLNTETIAYTATSTAAFLGATRGQWKTLAQYHYAADGERLRYPEITDLPVVLEGRRVRFYAYAPGDDKRGDGTLVWVGVASTDANFNGISWSFQVDSLFRILDQDIGGDLVDPVPIRGIYYPESGPLIVELSEYSGTTATGTPTRAWLALAGFWENQEDFLADLNTAIAARMTAASFSQTDIRAIPMGDSWAVAFTTDAATPLMQGVVAWSGVDKIGPERGVIGFLSPRLLDFPAGDPVSIVAAGTTYVYLQSDTYPGAGTVPRAIFGGYEGAAIQAEALTASEHFVAGGTSGEWTGDYPPFRIYVGGGAAITSNISFASVEWSPPGVPEVADAFSGTIPATLSTVDATGRYIETIRPSWGRPADGYTVEGDYSVAIGSGSVQIRMGRNYGTGNLKDFITSLQTQTPFYVNTGAVPFLLPALYGSGNIGDFILSDDEIPNAADAHRYTANRTYSVFSEVNLSELVEQECRLIGVYPVIETLAEGGSYLVFKRLRLPSPSEVGSSLTASVFLTDDQIVSWERAALGIYNTVRIHTGYDPIEDDNKGDVYKVRDVSAFGQSPNSRVLEITPKSGDPYGTISYNEMVDIGARVTGVFGGPYSFVTAEVPMSLWGTEPGDVVSITWSKLPNDDGTLGVTDKLGLVTGIEWKPMEGRGLMTVLTTDQRIGGYAPSAVLTSISGTTGTTGPFSASMSSSDFPSGESAADHFAAGDKIRVFRVDSTTTPGTITGTVTSVLVNSITFTTDSNWTRGSNTWALGFQVSTSITADGQKAYAFISKADGLVDWSGDTDNPPFTLAP